MQREASNGLSSHRRVSLVSSRLMSKMHKVLPKDKLGQLRIGVATWNVGGANPFQNKSRQMDVLEAFLPVDEGRHYDVFVVGLQECPSKSDRSRTEDDEDKLSPPGNVEESQKGSCCWRGCRKADDAIVSAIKSYMKGQHFTCMVSESLIQMRLLLFTNDYTTTSNVSSAEVGTRATGLLRLYGNKGGIVVRLVVKDVVVAFVACHLSAHSHCVPRRHQDLADVLEGSHIGRDDLDLLSQSSHVIIFGDLNYRLDPGYVVGTYTDKSPALTPAETDERAAKVLRALTESDYATLRSWDQLAVEMAHGSVLPDFKDALWSCKAPHQPTFKIVPQPSPSTAEQPRPSGPNQKFRVPVTYATHRVPSYCDRILYWTLPGCWQNFKLIDLKAVPAVLESNDHLPVVASLQIHMEKTVVVSLRRHNPRLHILDASIGVIRDSLGPDVHLALEVCGFPFRVMREISMSALGNTADPSQFLFDSMGCQLSVQRTQLTNVHILFRAFALTSRRRTFVGSCSVDMSNLSSDPHLEIHDRLRLNGSLTNFTFRCSLTIDDVPIDGHRNVRERFSRYSIVSWASDKRKSHLPSFTTEPRQSRNTAASIGTMKDLNEPL